ncbi:MAG: 50S ribosomal protein L5 [Bacteroidia bacterium]|jgi:large subunit ribosomal protein L5|nr:50S ribosomal protein L5 [Bacteroidia bacterium]
MANEPRLFEKYKKQVLPALMEKYKYTSVMQVPKLEKIVLNRGVGDAVGDKKLIEAAVEEFAIITGQRPVVTLSKKAISNFKLREDMPIGCKVTLRHHRMYEFLDRLINIALPRVRDFRGIATKGFDGRGNFTLGVKEQIIFPEINVDQVNKIAGMDITFVTTAPTDEECKALLTEFGMPFQGTQPSKQL